MSLRLSPEQREQIAFINYVKIAHRNLLFSISPQGMKMHKLTAYTFNLMGYRRGTPDVTFYEPRGKYHGMCIEMKTPKTVLSRKGVPTPEQLVFIAELKARGYAAAVCYGFEEAKNTLEKYLNLKDGE